MSYRPPTKSIRLGVQERWQEVDGPLPEWFAAKHDMTIKDDVVLNVVGLQTVEYITTWDSKRRAYGRTTQVERSGESMRLAVAAGSRIRTLADGSFFVADVKLIRRGLDEMPVQLTVVGGRRINIRVYSYANPMSI